MNIEYFISIFLDIRRAKRSGKYPVKLRVFTPEPRKQVLYPTIFEFSEKEFQSIWETLKTRREHQEDKDKLNALLAKANDIAGKLEKFTFEGFEAMMFDKKPKDHKDVEYYYQEAIELYKKNNQTGTAQNYEYSLKSLIEFNDNKRLNFKDITSQWLKEYEDSLTKAGKSKTTVGMYLRPLRAIFNTAISNNTIKANIYPFGKRKYTIPTPKGVKKALTKEDLKTLFNGIPKTPEQQKAKDFWFFSYSCNGMNFKDIANLKYKNVINDTIQFNREKTKNTNKNQAPVIVYLNDFTLSVIAKYGNENKSPESYIFSIIDHTSTPEKQLNQLKNFIRAVNQNFLKYAQSLEINYKISTYWARHSFATNAIRSGASLEFVSEALSHSNLKTTIGYFAGFESEKKREISKSLMNFDD